LIYTVGVKKITHAFNNVLTHHLMS